MDMQEAGQVDMGGQVAAAVPPPEPTVPKYFASIQNLKREQDASHSRNEWIIRLHRKMRALVCGPDHEEAKRSDGGADAMAFWADAKSSPTNPYGSAMTAYTARLASPELQVRILSKDAAVNPESAAKAKAIEALTNHQLRETDADEEHLEALQDALMCSQGVIWIGPLWGFNLLRSEGRNMDAGEVCVMRVDPSDFASDPNSSNAKSDTWRNVRYRVRKEWAEQKLEEAGIVLEKPLEGIKRNETSDNTSTPGVDNTGSSDVEYVELRDWYYFGEKTMTCTTTADCTQFLVPWQVYDGPNSGPIKVLTLQKIGGLRHGRAPLTAIMRTGETMDKVVSKVMDAALAAKTVFAIKEGSTFQDGMNLANAENLTQIKTAGDPREAMHAVEINPLIDQLMPVVQLMQELMASVSGDVYGSMGGTGDTKTARAAMIKQNNAMTLFGKLRGQVIKWEKQIGDDMLYWSSRILAGMTEPMGVLTRVSGSLNSQVLVLEGGPEFDPEQTQHETLLEMTTTAIPLADPSARLEQLLMLLGTALPNAIQVAQTGGNAGMVMRLIADYSGIAEFAQIFGVNGPDVNAAAAQQVSASSNKQAQQGPPAFVPGRVGPPVPAGQGAMLAGGAGQTQTLPANPQAGVPAMKPMQQGA